MQAQVTPFPVNEHNLCLFAAQLALDQVSHSSIKGYLSAVRHLQISQGHPDPSIATMPKLEGVIKGIKSTQAKSGTPKKNRLPITPAILNSIRLQWQGEGPSQDQVMLWAAATLCFFGFLRSGEITVPSDAAFDPSCHLTFQDISVDQVTDPQLLRVHLKSSKTDPFRKGVDVFVGRTSNELCPVAAMLAYLAIRTSKPGFLFQFADGRLLTKPRLVDELRKVLTAAGFNAKDYSGHSFRIGAATTAGACGLNDSTIQMLGRWSSSAYMLYIKSPRDKLAAYSSLLSKLS